MTPPSASSKVLSAADTTQRPRERAEFFGSTVDEWEEQYLDQGLRGRMARKRMALAFEYLDAEQVPAGASVLDLGCGPGVIAEKLLARDFFVTCVDFSAELLQRARSRLSVEGHSERVRFFQGDAQSLPFEDDTFDVVVCIGVISWVESPSLAMHEIARVLKPGGVLIITAINKFSVEALDPLVVWRKFARVTGLGRSARAGADHSVENPDNRPVSKRFSLARFDTMMSAEGLTKTRSRTIKYGHFRFLGRRFLPIPWEVAVDKALQRLWRVPIIRDLGWLYCVKAIHKPVKAIE